MEAIFTNPAYQLIAEKIFLNMDFEDLVAGRKKGGCELINKLCHKILKNLHFWLKRWTKNGLTTTDKAQWIRILDLAKNTTQEDDVLKYIKRVIQRGHFVSVPCYIDEKILERFSNLPEGQNLVDDVNSAMDEEEHGIIQLLAPLIKSQNVLNRGPPAPLKRKWRVIFWASEKGSKDIVQILAPLMVKPLTPNNDECGANPIHSAACNGHVNVVKFLANFTKIPNAPDRKGWTPIHSAAGNGHMEIIEYLVAFTDNANSPDQDGLTPIHEAACTGLVNVVKFLANFAENPNAPDSDGNTPINFAAEMGHIEVVQFLAPLVNNPNLPDNYGETPIDVATLNGHQDVVDVLTQYVN